MSIVTSYEGQYGVGKWNQIICKYQTTEQHTRAETVVYEQEKGKTSEGKAEKYVK